MAEETTLNDAGESSAPQGKVYGDLVETGVPPVEPSSNDAKVKSPGTPPPAEGGPGGLREESGEVVSDTDTPKETPEGKPTETPPDDLERFDRHPRFQELRETINQQNQMIRGLQERLDRQDQQQRQEQPAEDSIPFGEFRNLTEMSAEELLEWQSEDPHGYAGNQMRQMMNEALPVVLEVVREEFRNERQQTEARRTVDSYADANPTFDTMYASGELDRFIEKNPGHTYISAHQVLTAGDRQKAIDDAIDDAKEEGRRLGREEAAKQFNAKRFPKSLDAGPTAAGQPAREDLSPDLKNTKLHGGQLTVLTRRHIERLRRRGEA